MEKEEIYRDIDALTAFDLTNLFSEASHDELNEIPVYLELNGVRWGISEIVMEKRMDITRNNEIDIIIRPLGKWDAEDERFKYPNMEGDFFKL